VSPYKTNELIETQHFTDYNGTMQAALVFGERAMLAAQRDKGIKGR